MIGRISSLLMLVSIANANVAWEQIRDRLEEKGTGLWEIVDYHTQSIDNGMQVAFDVFGKEYKIDYQVDDMFVAPEFSHLEVSESGVVSSRSLRTENWVGCLWEHVSKNALGENQHSRANTCDGGLSASFKDEDIQFSLMDIGRNQAFVYRSDINIDKPWECHHSIDNHEFHHEMGKNRTLRSRRLADSGSGEQVYGGNKVKYIRLYIVNDYKRYLSVGKSIQGKTTSMLQQVQTLYDAFNLMSEYQIKLQIVGMMTFTRGDPWTVRQSTSAKVSAEELLDTFSAWRAARLSAKTIPKNALSYLLTDYVLADGVSGLANLRTICSKSAGSGVVQTSGYTDDAIAHIVTHQIAHNLGAKHTADTNPSSLVKIPCLEGKYIMDTTDSEKHSAWSTCTRDWIRMSFEGYPAGCATKGDGSCSVFPTYGTNFEACAETKETNIWSMAPVCGNGIKEIGEECDCGENCATVDPCCQADTCKLKSGAVCSALDGCCDANTCDVIPKSANKVCRTSKDGQCDIAETCDGESSVCPFDQVVPTGTSCGSFYGGGSCFAGSCKSTAMQCSDYGLSICVGWRYDQGDATCGALYCESNGDCIEVKTTEGTVKVNDGIVCENTASSDPFQRKVCNSGSCINSTLLKMPSSFFCSNGRFDPELGETDTDCGGPCFACVAKQQCLGASDCIGGIEQPALCEYTSKVAEAPVTGTCEDMLSDNTCSQYASCSWLNASCVTLQRLPAGTDTCESQTSYEDCEVYRNCAWDSNSTTCSSTSPDASMFGTCKSYTQASSDSEADVTPEQPDFSQRISQSPAVIVVFLLLAFILGTGLSAHIGRKHWQPVKTEDEAPAKQLEPAEGQATCPLCRIKISNPNNEGGLCNTCHDSVYILTQEPDEHEINAAAA